MVLQHVLVAFVLAAIPGTSASAAQQAIDQLPSGLREAVIESTYAAARTEDRAWRAPNPAQGMRTTFTAEHGVRIEGGAGERTWGLSLELEAWGRPGALVPVNAVEPVAHGRRVEYRRGSLTEWYVNDARGLEQGFTIDARPRGAGPLEVVLAVDGRFAAEVRPGGRDALFTGRACGTVLHYSGLRAWDADQRELDASLSIAGGQLSIRVDDGEAAYPVHVDPWIATEEAKLLPGDMGHDDYFGSAVAVSGDTAVVGAWGHDHSGIEDDVGAAYVFVRSGATWTEQQELMASDSTDGFGGDVAISGDRVVVGAVNQGAYVFVRIGSHWTEEAKLTASTPQGGMYFAEVVALSGDTALIGAPRYAEPGFNDRGAAYVFVRTGDGWIEEAMLTKNDPESFDWFGSSVAVDGDTALVGATGDSLVNGSNDDEGSVTVFVRSGGIWTEQQLLSGGNLSDGDEFGNSVALSGDTALVGSPLDNTPNQDSGSASVFVRSGTTWTMQQVLTPSDPKASDNFGESVALSGGTALVGVHADDFVNGVQTNEGSAYIYVSDGTAWYVAAKLTASDAAPGDQFGHRVGLSGDTAVVGVSEAIGGAYVYRLSSQSASSYCTAGTSASGCQALLSASGSASATAPSGFVISAAGVEGGKDGLYFFGTIGQQANSWGNGTSFNCVLPPVNRAPIMAGSGTNGLCDGTFAFDLNALWCPSCPSPAKNPGFGATVDLQLWYRDPASTSNQPTSLSDAVEFAVGL